MITPSEVTERSTFIEMHGGRRLYALAFSLDGEYLLSGSSEGVQVWRVEDGEVLVATMEAEDVNCLAISKDARWIAAGTDVGEVVVWNWRTCDKVWSHWEDRSITAVDFSPDATRLVVATASSSKWSNRSGLSTTIWDAQITANVWDFIAGKRVVGPLRHEDAVRAAKYSPKGDRIATATPDFVRVYDSDDGRLFVDISARVTPWYNTGLRWSRDSDHLFVISDNSIKQLDASTGSSLLEWSAPAGSYSSCIAASQHGHFIAHSAKHAVTFWDASTRVHLSVVQHAHDIRAIALSPDDRFLATCRESGQISIKRLSRITDSIPLAPLHPTFREPDIRVDDAVLSFWKNSRLAEAEALLTTAIQNSQSPTFHLCACRALVRARLRYWNTAIEDAKESIKMQPSVLAYIALGVALVGKGDRDDGYRACDIAFEHFHSTHVSFLLLFKAVIMFMAGEHNAAIMRLHDLIETVHMNSICYVVQAYMHFSLGESCLESGDHDGAIQSLERARTQMRHHRSRPLFVISLMSGWEFDDLGITIRQCLCKTLYAVGRVKAATETVLETVSTYAQEIYSSRIFAGWVSDIAQRCLSSTDMVSSLALCDEKLTLDVTLNSEALTPLVTEWVKLKLTSGSWNDILVTAIGFAVPRFMIYRAICDRLEMTDRITDAIMCFNRMDNELAQETGTNGDLVEWHIDFKRRCAKRLEHFGDTAVDAQKHDDGIVQYSAALALDPVVPQDILIKRSKAYMVNGLWGDALEDAKQVVTLDPTSSWRYERVLESWANVTVMRGSWKSALITTSGFKVPRLAIYQAICEHLETLECTVEAVECFLKMTNELGRATDNKQVEWTLGFELRCSEKLEDLGDIAMDAWRHDEAVSRYSVALSLSPASPRALFMKRSKAYMMKGQWKNALSDANKVVALDPSSQFAHKRILIEWANVKLADDTWVNALLSASHFEAPKFAIYQAICERLETVNCITEATKCFQEMMRKVVLETDGEQTSWILDFKSRCCDKLEELGDTSRKTQQYDEAISRYSAALSLDPTFPQALLIKRGKARAARGLWEDALSDANQVIMLDPSSPFGYERKYVASRGAGHHKDTLDSFEMMLLKMSESQDEEIQMRGYRYAKTRKTIRKAVQDTIRDSPRVLINTASGLLCDKYDQAVSFELSLVFMELIWSTTTHTDRSRIKQEVAEYFRYAMLSHKWGDIEPLFDQVTNTAVYELDESPNHEKLKIFCKVAREAGFIWAWSDTCCINKADHFVLQEALVSMFKWYEGSALTIVYLLGVRSPSQRGDLVKSVWNTRAWTFQEYHASKVVRFFNEDWTLYLNIGIPNHKEAPEIISEMEEATGVLAQALVALRPGLDDIREKLCLASKRKTSMIEDAAYSLLGIFSMTLPIVYGEGDKALGRLLAQLLTSSGDTSILAWTGKSGNFNSCLPGNIIVFNRMPTTHIPSAIQNAEINTATARLQASPVDLTSATQLYDRLYELPVPLCVGQRMKLPCLKYKLGRVSVSQSRLGNVFRAQTAALGIVEIRTNENLSALSPLYLVHPWIDFLLDRQPVGSVRSIIPEENIKFTSSPVGELVPLPDTSNTTAAVAAVGRQRSASWLAASIGWPFGGQPTISPSRDAVSLRPPSSMSEADKQMQALRLVARLRQPFGALLFTPTRQNVAEYRRVASEILITVQVEEITTAILNKLVDSVCILDVL